MNLILEAGGDATYMLASAAREGREKTVDLLIKSGADVNKYNILDTALESGSVQSAKSILAAGVDLAVKKSLLAESH